MTSSALRPINPSIARHFPTYVIIGILALAAGIRGYHLGLGSFWHDEGLIWAAAQGSLTELLHGRSGLPIPPGYFALVRLVGDVWGTSEIQLRSVSLIAGVLAVGATAVLAREWLSWTGTAVATGMTALSYWQVVYSRQVREYTVATLFTVLVYLGVLGVVRRRANAAAVVIYSAVAIIGILLQFGMIIGVSTAHIIYFCHIARQHTRRELVLFLVSSAVLVVALSYTIALVLALPSQTRAVVFGFLEPYLLTPTNQIEIIGFLWRNTIGLFRFAFGQQLWPVFGVAIIVGIETLWSEGSSRRLAVVCLLLPLLAVIVLAFLRLYPYGGVRQDIILLPMLYIVAAAGIDHAHRNLLKSGVLKGLLVIVYVVFSLQALRPLYAENSSGEDIKPALDYLREHMSTADGIHVYYGAAPAFKYYWEGRRMGEHSAAAPIVWGAPSREEPTRYLTEVQSCFAQRDRCWIVFSHTYDFENLSEQELIVSWLLERYDLAAGFPEPSARAGKAYVDTAVYLFAAR